MDNSLCQELVSLLTKHFQMKNITLCTEDIESQGNYTVYELEIDDADNREKYRVYIEKTQNVDYKD